jgi:hypothetical protein
MINRIDPIGCGCTDCLIGYSKPIDYCDQGELALAMCGAVDNASDHKITRTFSYELED